MRIPDPERLNPAQARKAINTAKSDKAVVAALLDRDHPDHKPAVDKWYRLHQAAYPEPTDSRPGSALHGTKRRHLIDSGPSTVSTGAEGRTNDASKLAAQSRQSSLEHGTSTSNASTADRRRSNRKVRPRQPLGKSIKQAGSPVEEQDDWTENWFAEGEHFYDRISPPVCAASECSLDDVVAALNEIGVHPNQSKAFVPGETYIGDVDIPGPFGTDDVTTSAIFKDGVQIGVKNVTLENHALHPGTVERTVILSDGSYRIRTRGSGTGRWGRPNVSLNDVVWGSVDNRVIDVFR